MSRRLHSCLTCTGKTRHRAACGPCRRRGVVVTADEIILPLVVHVPPSLTLLQSVKDPMAPTLAELRDGVDLTPFLAGP